MALGKGGKAGGAPDHKKKKGAIRFLDRVEHKSAEAGSGAHAASQYGYMQNEEFFIQAEEGIRDYKVTGVQTCALPICWLRLGLTTLIALRQRPAECRRRADSHRSEERRVGKECRSRWSPYH